MLAQKAAAPNLELWGGVECTVNRVGDQYYDQLERNGHAARAADLDLFATLGVRAMRYPVLWERIAPKGLEHANWSWADERLGRLRELRIKPIIGLLHHGSGPLDTSLVDPAFPEKLAGFARAVAERYPWANAYTPVNEPLTTARFSALYGFWYPHKRDDRTFARALLTQCRGIVLAMRAIREINSDAQLVQTEDLGKTFSTGQLGYQAEFENERRWLTYDLLAGRVTADHPMWSYLKWAGVSEDQLAWFQDHPCPPDIVGINHYLTSERFLDERLHRYPKSSHGGNGRDAYADVEAVRVCAEGVAGPKALMRETWERYQLPLAITEVHLGCTREEQLRWFKEVWDAASDLRLRDGIDVRAVTAWSLLGAYDWHNLLTREENFYEPGVFDLRAPKPRPTALVAMLRDLAEGRQHEHPVLSTPGWWRRLDRLHYPAVAHRRRPVSSTAQSVNMKGEATRPLLITGATGTLGRAFARICEGRGLAYRLLTRAEMDIAEVDSVERMLVAYHPWAVINTAGYVRVDDAEREAAKCYRENTTGAAVLAEACARFEIGLVTFSSDLVFGGDETRREPYLESDCVCPQNVYGESKAEAERRVLQALPNGLVIRTSAFFGPWDEYNFVTLALRAMASGRRFKAADDSVVSPTYVPDLVHASLDLLIDGESGVWHIANRGATTWFDLARQAADLSGLDANLIDACRMSSFGLPARRPSFSVLGTERGMFLPSLDDALSRYMNQCEMRWIDNIGSAAIATRA